MTNNKKKSLKHPRREKKKIKTFSGTKLNPLLTEEHNLSFCPRCAEQSLEVTEFLISCNHCRLRRSNLNVLLVKQGFEGSEAI